MTTDETTGNVLLTTEQAARIVGATRRLLEEYRRKGGGPKFVRLSPRMVRYRVEDLNEWITSNLKSSTADY
jgi:predicted DNA-binding transcriptional regulator AlpA